MTNNNALSTPVVETIAGFTAGVISTLCLHPLDLIKTRLQGIIYPPPPSLLNGALQIMRSIWLTCSHLPPS